MSLADDMTADFLSIWEEMQTKVDFLAQEGVHALVSSGSLSMDLAIGGFDARRTLTVKVLLKDLTSELHVGDPVEFNQVTYRISTISTKPPLPICTLECQES